ncbi:MAG: HEAT repeat domain-containing protein [Planctomycetia bacterium]|nr:HEAT repeat domain-containing protein [Planctomycetia bacterium]
MRFLPWLSGLACLLAAPCLAAQKPADLARARPVLERQLRDPSAGNRQDALDELGKYRFPEAAQLALPLTADPDPRVRLTAFRTLAHLQEEPAVRAAMLKTLQAGISEQTRPLLVAVLGGTADAKTLLQSLNKSAKGQPVVLLHLLTMAEEISTWSDPAAVRVLERMTLLDAFPQTLGLRRAVVKGLLYIRLNEAVPVLIDLLGKLDGELAFQINDHLDKISGESFAFDAESARKWWQANREGYRYPSPTALPAPRVPRVEVDGASYYGMQIRARHMIFVMDISGSMAGARLQHAKKELVQAIQKLPSKSQFNLVFFNNKLHVWSPKLVEATPEAKKQAVYLIENLAAGGNTHTYDALRVALDLKVEHIYLLTDGQPTGGAIVQTDTILATIRPQNRLPGIAISTIGLAPGPDSGPFSKFLQSLADQNHGQYRKVE